VTSQSGDEGPGWESFTDVIARITAPVVETVSVRTAKLTAAVDEVQGGIGELADGLRGAERRLNAEAGRRLGVVEERLAASGQAIAAVSDAVGDLAVGQHAAGQRLHSVEGELRSIEGKLSAAGRSVTEELASAQRTIIGRLEETSSQVARQDDLGHLRAEVSNLAGQVATLAAQLTALAAMTEQTAGLVRQVGPGSRAAVRQWLTLTAAMLALAAGIAACLLVAA
jgi:chromosome segregation ATPase